MNEPTIEQPGTDSSDQRRAVEMQRPPQGPKRRDVKYTTIPGFLKDAKQLAAGPHETTGNWSYGQIMQHLAKSVNASFDGFEYKMNWLMRTAAIWLMKEKMLAGPMPTGFKIPPKAHQVLPDDEVSTEQGLQELAAAVGRFERETPNAFHPGFGNLNPEEWTKFHLRHAELHMSYVWPA